MSSVLFILPYSANSADMSSKSLTGGFRYNNSAQNGNPVTALNYDIAKFNIGLWINVRWVINKTTEYDLANLLTNARYFKANSTFSLVQTQTYDYNTALSTIASEGTEITQSAFLTDLDFSISEDNVISGSYHRTTLRSVTQVSTSEDYAMVLPNPWYFAIGSGRALTQTLTNCTSDVSTATIDTTSVTVTLTTTDSNYEFDTANSPITVTGCAYSITYSNDNTVATIVLDSGSDGVTINASAVRWFNLDLSSLSHCTCNISDTEKLYPNNDYNITITSDNGYYFDVAPTVRYYVYSAQGLVRPQTLTLIADSASEYPTSFSGVFNTETSEYGGGVAPFPVTATAILIPISDKYGFIKIYNPTSAELDSLSNERFTYGGTPLAVTIDLGDYILNLFKVFVNVPVYGTESIQLGGYVTSVSSNVILEDIIETDCDTISISRYFNNEMDYKNTYIRAYLPLIGFVDLDSDRVIGKTLHLIYKTNIINGDSLAIISDDDTDDIIYTYNCTAAFMIPYLLNQQNNPHGELKIDSNYLYGFTPFIEIERNMSYNTSNVVADDNKYVSLDTLIGYHAIDVIDCNIDCDRELQGKIINLLRNGVIF